MRYFEFIINVTAEQIKAGSKINLRDYSWENPIAGMNIYMYKNMKNDYCFFVYREVTKENLLAVFSYDERTESFEEAYSYICKSLNDIFSITDISEKPYEITMQQFYDALMESRRRDYINGYTRMIETANLNPLEYYRDDKVKRGFEFGEKVINENTTNRHATKKSAVTSSYGENTIGVENLRKQKIQSGNKMDNCIYDQSFLDEISNIEAHSNSTEFSGNMVHYFISSKGREAACNMAEKLAVALARANRISGRRMEIISEIDPDLYKLRCEHLEEIIENNYGGIIVLDLSEKFGHSPTEYKMTCKYIEQLVKKYKNDCLFVFTYNVDNPGFSYFLLPELRKYIIPVNLQEGLGSRKEAVNYLKDLIKQSEYSKYASQAAEFMKQFSGEKFSQTEVLTFYEQFEGWCLNKNILKAYSFDSSEDFILDRDKNKKSSYEQLKSLIGLTMVKQQIDRIIDADIVEKERKKRIGSSYPSNTMHMVFGGNPGTAKTTVARLFAGVAKEKEILKSGVFIERGGLDLEGFGYVHKIRDAFEAAKGGVLFIDEAYSLNSDDAVTVLIQEMENHRDEVIVILAGYNERMDAFMEINEGLKSRVPFRIDFPDYSAEELTDIFKLMLKERGFTATEDAVKEAGYIFDKVCNIDNFGNGRYVRNLIERAMQNQSVRLLTNRDSAKNIKNKELFLLEKEDICALEDDLQDASEEGFAKREVGDAKKELDEMIGLTKVKQVINKAMAGCKIKKICMEKGIHKGKSSLHMVFTGNPGTAKTTVARLFAEIMKDEKVLSTGKFVEVGRADLVGPVVGSTAIIVKKKFKEAQGGVLFIDEAYSLCDFNKNSFGDEAINTIVQEMENHRDKVIVIFAGYPEEMKEFLDRNPGLSSRIAFHVDFDDYSTEDLCDITKLMLEKKQMKITETAMNKLRSIYEQARKSNDFGNGRFARKILEEAEMNQAERLLQLDVNCLTEEIISTIEECDIPNPELPETNQKEKIKFGFAC